LDKIKIEGPGVSDSRGVKASVPTYFVVDATDAGSGKLDLRIMVSYSGKYYVLRLSYDILLKYDDDTIFSAAGTRWFSQEGGHRKER